MQAEPEVKEDLGQYSRVVNTIRTGRNVFITGSAGTGKSFILGKLRETFPEMDVTSSTGASAMNVEGVTIHSWAGIGIGQVSAENLMYQIKPESFNNIKYCKLLAIDEISMINENIFNLLNEVFKLVRGSKRPFGGIQLVVIGDFLQLPPVSDDEKEQRFAFESYSWKEAGFANILLSKCYRQEDPLFLDLLGRVRYGVHTQDDITTLASTNKFGMLKDPIQLFALNKPADSFNLDRLREVKGPSHFYEGEDRGTTKGLEALNRYSLVPKDLFLKVGARVMLLINYNQGLGLINGSTGYVKETRENGALVAFDNGQEEFFIKQTVKKVTVKNEVIARRDQLPLRLAWAISIHKSQGMTLTKVNIDMQGIFEFGQAYVALSRAKTIEGLRVLNLRAEMIKAHPRAIEFIQNLN